jgi:hypothetical protein
MPDDGPDADADADAIGWFPVVDVVYMGVELGKMWSIS